MGEVTAIPDKYFDCIIAEYNILWDYYKHAIQERENSYHRYFKSIALPATAIGAFATFFESVSSITIWGNKISLFASLLLIIISIVGLSIYVTYILEAINSEALARQINAFKSNITQHNSFFNNFMAPSSFTSEKDEQVKKLYIEIEESKNIFTKSKKYIAILNRTIGRTKLARSMALPLINAAFIPFVFLLNTELTLVAVFLLYILFVFLHLGVLYWLNNNLAEEKELRVPKNSALALLNTGDENSTPPFL